MLNPRKIILKQLETNGWTINHFAKQVEGKVGRMTVYDYLRGEDDGKWETIVILLEAAGLKVSITQRGKIHPGKEKK